MYSKYGSVDNLRITEVETPAPKNGEVLVEVKAASVNDWDWCLVNGSPFYIRLLCGLTRPKIGIPGVDIAGRIVAVGQNVKHFKPGDQVYGDLSESGFGGFAEYVCAPEHALALKPDNITYAEAAAIPHAAMLAVQSLHNLAKIRPGQTLLINGAGGGVGTLGVQIARAAGIEYIVGVDSGEKLDMMRSLGFDYAIDYRCEDFTKSKPKYDVILDPKTNRSIFSYLRVLNAGGSYITVGGSTGRLLQALICSSIIRFIFKKNVSVLALKPNKDLEYINTLLKAGRVKSVIDGPYSFEHAVEAIRRFGEARHIGKVVITMKSSTGQ